MAQLLPLSWNNTAAIARAPASRICGFLGSIATAVALPPNGPAICQSSLCAVEAAGASEQKRIKIERRKTLRLNGLSIIAATNASDVVFLQTTPMGSDDQAIKSADANSLRLPVPIV